MPTGSFLINGIFSDKYKAEISNVIANCLRGVQCVVDTGNGLQADRILNFELSQGSDNSFPSLTFTLSDQQKFPMSQVHIFLRRWNSFLKPVPSLFHSAPYNGLYKDSALRQVGMMFMGFFSRARPTIFPSEELNNTFTHKLEEIYFETPQFVQVQPTSNKPNVHNMLRCFVPNSNFLEGYELAINVFSPGVPSRSSTVKSHTVGTRVTVSLLRRYTHHNTILFSDAGSVPTEIDIYRNIVNEMSPDVFNSRILRNNVRDLYREYLIDFLNLHWMLEVAGYPYNTIRLKIVENPEEYLNV